MTRMTRGESAKKAAAYDADMAKAQKRERQKVTNETLIYPIDSAGDEFYPESIKFTIYKRHGASLEKIQTAMSTIATRVKDAAMPDEKITEMIGEIKKQLEETEGETARTKMMARIDELKMLYSSPSLADVASNSAQEGVNIIKEGSAGLRQKSYMTLIKEGTDQLGEIYLNMPNEIAFTDQSNWEGAELGEIVGGMAKGKGGFSDSAASGMFSNFSNIAGGGTGALTSMLLRLPGGAAAGAILGSLGGSGLQKGLESGTGQITNPYKEMTFSGIDFRDFTFNFTFRARNQTEVMAVQNIIETFRYFSKPLYTHGKSGFFSYPEEFHIEFLTKNADKFETNEYIPQIKMCVCKNVTTNFAAQNAWRSLENGAPAEISLGLSFTETELVTGEDIIGTTEIGRFAGTNRRF